MQDQQTGEPPLLARQHSGSQVSHVSQVSDVAPLPEPAGCAAFVDDPQNVRARQSRSLKRTSQSSSNDASSLQEGRQQRSRSRSTSTDSAGRSNNIPREASDLPDLTSKIVSLGLYDEYKRFRDGYLRWREGSPYGASYELSTDGLYTANVRLFHHLYPSFDMWQWRRTASYWIVVTFFEGSLLFCAGSAFSCVHWSHERHPWALALTSWPDLVGGLLFLLGTFLMCMESANLMKKDIQYWPFRWRAVREHYGGLNMKRTPYFVGLSYFVGVLVYTPPLLLEFRDFKSWELDQLFKTLPYAVGGFLFTIGGYLECVENKVLTSSGCSLSCCAALGNFLGGLLFFVGAMLRIYSRFLCDLCFSLGAAIFAVGSVMNLWQWRDEHFGLTFLSALNKIAVISNQNRAASAARPIQSGVSAKFSVRGLIFVCFYCALATVSVYNFGLMFVLMVHRPALHTGTALMTELINFVLMHMVLIMHSAVVQIPKTQPYHVLVIGSRYVAALMGINSIATFVSWLPHVISQISGGPDMGHNWNIRGGGGAPRGMGPLHDWGDLGDVLGTRGAGLHEAWV